MVQLILYLSITFIIFSFGMFIVLSKYQNLYLLGFGYTIMMLSGMLLIAVHDTSADLIGLVLIGSLSVIILIIIQLKAYYVRHKEEKEVTEIE